MIFTALLIILRYALLLLLLPFPLMTSEATSFVDALTFFVGQMKLFDAFFPVGALMSAIILVATIELLGVVFKIVRFVIRVVRGGSI